MLRAAPETAVLAQHPQAIRYLTGGMPGLFRTVRCSLGQKKALFAWSETWAPPLTNHHPLYDLTV